MQNDALAQSGVRATGRDFPEQSLNPSETSFEARAMKVIDLGLKATAPESKAVAALFLTFILTILTILRPEKGIVKLAASTIFAVAAGCICSITKRK